MLLLCLACRAGLSAVRLHHVFLLQAATKPLRSLDVSNNKIKVGQSRIASVVAGHATTPHAWLQALSPGLFASLGSSLVSFNIASNALSALPDEIGQLRCVRLRHGEVEREG